MAIGDKKSAVMQPPGSATDGQALVNDGAGGNKYGGYTVPAGGLPGQVLTKSGTGDGVTNWGGYVVNDSLIRNGYFAGGGTPGNFPINQRGLSSRDTVGMFIDQWFISSGAVTLTRDGLTGTMDTTLDQRIELSRLKEGQTVTLSFLASDGLHSTTVTLANAAWGAISVGGGFYARVLTQADSYNVASIRWGDSEAAGKTVYAVKLEFGDTQTLAHQDESGNWVLNEVPDYATELAKCQRYYISLTLPRIFGVEVPNLNRVFMFVNTPVTMSNIVPVVTVKDPGTIIVGGQVYTPVRFTCGSPPSATGVLMEVELPEGATAGSYSASILSDSIFSLSCEMM